MPTPLCSSCGVILEENKLELKEGKCKSCICSKKSENPILSKNGVKI